MASSSSYIVLDNSGAQRSAAVYAVGAVMLLGFLPPAFGDAGSRFCSSQAAAGSTLSTASIGRLATAMMKSQQPRTISGGGGGGHKMQATAVAALSAVGGWMSKDREEDSIMAKRFHEWIHGGDQGLARDSRDNALRRRRRHAAAEKSLLGPSSPSTLESESELAAADGGGGGTVVSTVDEPVIATASNSVSPETPAAAPATNRSRFGFLGRLFFRPPPPSEVDWVEAGAVSLIVRTQDDCGSCWAMAVAAAVEAAHYLKTKEHVPLSVQELVDCDTANRGCNGGRPYLALEYVTKNGLSAESSYPYIDQRSAMGCSRAANSMSPPAATISGYRVVFPNEAALERAVAKGPVVVGMQCSDEMLNYEGGIMEYRATPYTAARRRLDGGTFPSMHAILMVGYGTDDNGVKYWRFKNSWGSGWGEWGFGRFRRRACGRRGAAGLCMFPAVYPVLD